MANRKPRKLWLEIRWHPSTPGTKETRINVLINAIQYGHRTGDYRLPRGYKVALGWRNKEFAAMKWGEFSREMEKSAQSSEGWDFAVLAYLESQLEEEQ
jgi:hypothetical protein